MQSTEFSKFNFVSKIIAFLNEECNFKYKANKNETITKRPQNLFYLKKSWNNSEV